MRWFHPVVFSATLILFGSSLSTDATAVLKARKLIDGDKVDFLLGNTNSALSLAMAQVSNEKQILHVVPGGHTDAVTGEALSLECFPRLQRTTQMEAEAVTSALIKEYGKKFYYITWTTHLATLWRRRWSRPPRSSEAPGKSAAL